MSRQYDEYICSHISLVNKALEWIIDNCPKAVESFSKRELAVTRDAARHHDTSKRDPIEYDAYDNYFYGEKDENAFNFAWLHHIHNNPHHWQHWVLINDDDGTVALEMPKHFALEMIADWWSFSWRSGNLYEVFDWYEKRKNRIMLHPNTREYVESVLAEIREKLDEDA